MAWRKARWLTPQESFAKSREIYDSDKDLSEESKKIFIERLKTKYGWDDVKNEPTKSERDFMMPSYVFTRPEHAFDFLLDKVYESILNNDEDIKYPINSTLLSSLAKNNEWDIGYDDDSDSKWEGHDYARIPLSFVKDKDKIEYLKLYKQLLDKVPEVTDRHDVFRAESSGRGTFSARAHKFLTTKALKNILKSTNIDRAINEIRDFYQDYRESADKGIKFDSLNQLREYPNKIAYANDMVEQLRNLEVDTFIDSDVEDVLIDILKEKFNIDVSEEHTEGYIPELINDELHSNEFVTLIEELDKRLPTWKDILKEVEVEEAGDFKYVPTIEAAIDSIPVENKRGWRVIKNKQDMIDTGTALEHCYGYLKRYGNSHHKNYFKNMRNNKIILLTNGKVTAEIHIRLNPEGQVVQADVGQIQGLGNTNRGTQPGQLAQVEEIANHLYGKTFDTPDISDRRCKFVRHMETHDWDREPNIINALNRRF